MIELIIDTSPFEAPDSKTKLDFVRIKCLIGFLERDVGTAAVISRSIGNFKLKGEIYNYSWKNILGV